MNCPLRQPGSSKMKIVHPTCVKSALKTKSENAHLKFDQVGTICIFPGHHEAQLENSRGIASLIEEAVNDVNPK